MGKTRIAVICESPAGGALALAKALEAAEEKVRLPAEKRVDFLDPGTMKPVKAQRPRAEGTLEFGANKQSDH